MDAFVSMFITVLALAAIAFFLWRIYVRDILVLMPEPVEGEDLHRVTDEEAEVLQRLAEDFVLYVVMNKEEQNSALDTVASWEEGCSIREAAQSLVACLNRLETVSRRRIEIELGALQQACEGISPGSKVECFVVDKLVVLRAFVRCLERELAPER